MAARAHWFADDEAAAPVVTRPDAASVVLTKGPEEE